jgi:hypothetical protein
MGASLEIAGRRIATLALVGAEYVKGTFRIDAIAAQYLSATAGVAKARHRDCVAGFDAAGYAASEVDVPGATQGAYEGILRGDYAAANRVGRHFSYCSEDDQRQQEPGQDDQLACSWLDVLYHDIVDAIAHFHLPPVISRLVKLCTSHPRDRSRHARDTCCQYSSRRS